MRHFQEYFKPLIKYWWGVLSVAASIIAAVDYFKKSSISDSIHIGIMFGCFIIAAVNFWWVERKRANAAEEKLIASQNPGESQTVIHIRNVIAKLQPYEQTILRELCIRKIMSDPEAAALVKDVITTDFPLKKLLKETPFLVRDPDSRTYTISPKFEHDLPKAFGL